MLLFTVCQKPSETTSPKSYLWIEATTCASSYTEANSKHVVSSFGVDDDNLIWCVPLHQSSIQECEWAKPNLSIFSVGDKDEIGPMQCKGTNNNKICQQQKYSHFREHNMQPSEYRLSDPDDSHSAWTGTCHRAPDVGAKRGWAVPCRGTDDQISEPSWPQQGSCRECLKGRRPSKNCTSCLRPSWCDQGDLYPDLVSLGFHTYLWKDRPVTPDLRKTEQSTKYQQMHGSVSSQSTNIFLRWR